MAKYNHLNWASHDLHAWEDWSDLVYQAIDLGISVDDVDALKPDPRAHWSEVDRRADQLRALCERMKVRGHV